jgi:hypothetical protein
MTFDLEKARACAAFVEPKEAFLEALDEIERLRALRSDIITIINRPKTTSDKGLLLYIRDEVDYNIRQATQIGDLETEIEMLQADAEQYERVIEARSEVIDQQADKIKELEAQLTITNVALENATRKPNVVYITGTGELGPDADAKPREGLYGKYRISKADGSPVDPNADYFVLRLDTDPVARRAAREYSYMTVDRKLALELQKRITRYNPKMMDCINLQFFGVEKPRVWQITEERTEALQDVIDRYDVYDRCLVTHDWKVHVLEVLRAMLTEAGQ